jgi:hypothetical protein
VGDVVGFRAPSEPSAESFAPDAPPAAVPSPLVDASRDPPARAVDRSFFAQPVPLNTIAGGANALRNVSFAPQTGHVSAGPPWIEWTISTREPHDEQRYS